jgi:hypothetical protein
MRTLEFQRPMLRATNTGATAIIDHRGQVVADLPPFTRGVLEAQQGKPASHPMRGGPRARRCGLTWCSARWVACGRAARRPSRRSLTPLLLRTAARPQRSRRAPFPLIELSPVQRAAMLSFQQLILTPQTYWMRRLRAAAALRHGSRRRHQPHGDVFSALGPEPWKAAYVQPSRRPATGAMARTRTGCSTTTSTRWC